MVLFFGFLFHRYGLDTFLRELGTRERPIAYLDFLTPGVCAMTVLFGASQSGIGWIRDLQTGFAFAVAMRAMDTVHSGEHP